MVLAKIGVIDNGEKGNSKDYFLNYLSQKGILKKDYMNIKRRWREDKVKIKQRMKEG